MFMSMLWDTIFSLSDRYEEAQVFLIDNRIPALRLGTADKPAVFAAGFGADEWQTGVLLLRFFERLLRAGRNGGSLAGIAIKKAFKKRSVIIIPTVCPAKMATDGATASRADTDSIGRYLRFHPASVFVALEKEGGHIFHAPGAETGADTDTIAKVLCACSCLPVKQSADSPAAALCETLERTLALPAFSIAPAALESAESQIVYRSLEECFVVAALM